MNNGMVPGMEGDICNQQCMVFGVFENEVYLQDGNFNQTKMRF